VKVYFAVRNASDCPETAGYEPSTAHVPGRRNRTLTVPTVGEAWLVFVVITQERLPEMTDQLSITPGQLTHKFPMYSLILQVTN